jgi:hypothetical protein
MTSRKQLGRGFMFNLLRAIKILIRSPEYVNVRDAKYNKDGLITFHGSDFLEDPLFVSAYALGKKTGSWGDSDLEWRAYIACWAANNGKNIEGDFVECGVNRGGLSRTVMHYIDFENIKNKKFYLLDTYCGFPDKFKHLTAKHYVSCYSECYDDVVRTFSGFENAVIIAGIVPDTLSQVKAEKVCYLSIDMNCAEPEVAAAEFFWDKLSRGAVVVLDDYNFSPEYYRQKKAFNDFAERKGVQILSLPTGQGLIFRP